MSDIEGHTATDGLSHQSFVDRYFIRRYKTGLFYRFSRRVCLKVIYICIGSRISVLADVHHSTCVFKSSV